jgi:2-C-methyl-D-erythritol 2,4-cyclodiphosphate synthase
MFKVTDSGDLEMARAISTAGTETRGGFGFDLHRLVAGRPLILGGVRFPFPRGLEGHSDADIVCHSLCDAIMGASGLGDMGARFGVRRAGTRGMSSLKFLAETAKAVREAGWKVRMADATLMIQEPRIAPRRELMRKRIAESLGTTVDRVSVKATTAKHSGPIGAGEAMACFALVTLSGRPRA